MMETREEMRARVARALGTDDEGFFEAVKELAEMVITALGAQAGDVRAEPHVSKGFACQASGVDVFMEELEFFREVGRKIRAGQTLEEAEARG